MLRNNVEVLTKCIIYNKKHHTMKNIILVIITLTTCFLHAQSVEYTYDNAGNRIQRKVITVNGMQQNNGSDQQALVKEKIRVDSGAVLVNLYPNPTAAKVHVTLTFQDIPQQTVQLQLFNSSGKLLKNKTVRSLQSQFDLQPYPPGVYYVKILSPENKVMKEVKILRK